MLLIVVPVVRRALLPRARRRRAGDHCPVHGPTFTASLLRSGCPSCAAAWATSRGPSAGHVGSHGRRRPERGRPAVYKPARSWVVLLARTRRRPHCHVARTTRAVVGDVALDVQLVGTPRGPVGANGLCDDAKTPLRRVDMVLSPGDGLFVPFQWWVAESDAAVTVGWRNRGAVAVVRAVVGERGGGGAGDARVVGGVRAVGGVKKDFGRGGSDNGETVAR